jgi:hypothetical protein
LAVTCFADAGFDSAGFDSAVFDSEALPFAGFTGFDSDGFAGFDSDGFAGFDSDGLAERVSLLVDEPRERVVALGCFDAVLEPPPARGMR